MVFAPQTKGLVSIRGTCRVSWVALMIPSNFSDGDCLTICTGFLKISRCNLPRYCISGREIFSLNKNYHVYSPARLTFGKSFLIPVFSACLPCLPFRQLPSIFSPANDLRFHQNSLLFSQVATHNLYIIDARVFQKRDDLRLSFLARSSLQDRTSSSSSTLYSIPLYTSQTPC